MTTVNNYKTLENQHHDLYSGPIEKGTLEHLAIKTIISSTDPKVLDSQYYYKWAPISESMDVKEHKRVQRVLQDEGNYPIFIEKSEATDEILTYFEDEAFQATITRHLEKLATLTDEELKEGDVLDKIVRKLPYPFHIFTQVGAGHGHYYEDGRRKHVDLFMHSLEVIRGNFGGFGLRTDLSLEGLSDNEARRVLRIAALFHDSGKCMPNPDVSNGPYHFERNDHDERSARFARNHLQEHFEAWGISHDEALLIEHLIRHKESYVTIYSTREHPKDFIEMTLDAYKELPQMEQLEISLSDFRKLLFSLWLADASTLPNVNGKGRKETYQPYFEDMDILDFASMPELSALSNKIVSVRKAAREAREQKKHQ